MNIHKLEDALMQLKDEDIDHLNNYKEELKIKLKEISQKNIKLFSLEEENKRLEILNSICENKTEYHKNILYLLGIFIPILSILIIPINGLSFSFIAVSLSLSLLIFIIYCRNVLDKINTKEHSLIENFIFAIKKTLGNKRNLKREYIIISEDVKKILEEIDILSSETALINSHIDQINDELSYIEGNLIGLDKLDNKYNIKEVPNENSIVQYITDKKLVRKPSNIE